MSAVRLRVEPGENENSMRLVGELDISTVEDAARALAAAASLTNISLDLSELTFIDSSGVRLLLNLIRDYFASSFGGYHELLAIHAEGSLEAQKITILRGFDTSDAVAFAAECAGVDLPPAR